MNRVASTALTITTLILLGLGLAGTGTASAATTDLTITGSQSGDGTVGYDITNVPRVAILPGSCITYLVDALKAAPIFLPAYLNAGSSVGNIDMAALVPELLDAGAVVGGLTGGRLQVASRDNTISGQFTGVPNGVYILATVCNATASGTSGPIIVGPGSGSLGSGSGSGSSTGSGSGSSSGSGGTGSSGS